ncbi:hypothetical protein B0H19DRAFT_1075777 [Mycena capillaripes]|nr:hypothetical protein B0H19DRAFT_1075777 [Mycena capillaripes]
MHDSPSDLRMWARAGEYQRRHTMSEARRMVVVWKREGCGAKSHSRHIDARLKRNCDVIHSAVSAQLAHRYAEPALPSTIIMMVGIWKIQQTPPESSQGTSRLAFLASARDSLFGWESHDKCGDFEGQATGPHSKF